MGGESENEDNIQQPIAPLQFYPENANGGGDSDMEDRQSASFNSKNSSNMSSNSISESSDPE